MPRWAQLFGSFGLGVGVTVASVTLAYSDTAHAARHAQARNVEQDATLSAHDLRLRSVETFGAATLARLESIGRDIAEIKESLRRR